MMVHYSNTSFPTPLLILETLSMKLTSIGLKMQEERRVPIIYTPKIFLIVTERIMKPHGDYPRAMDPMNIEPMAHNLLKIMLITEPLFLMLPSLRLTTWNMKV